MEDRSVACVEALAEAVPSLEEDLREYVGSVVEECVDGWSGEEDLVEALSDLLIGYGVAEEEEDVIVLCGGITCILREKGLIPDWSDNFDGHAAAKIADGELTLLSNATQIEQFERLPVVLTELGGLHEKPCNAAIPEASLSMSKTATKKEERARKRRENMGYDASWREYSPEADDDVELDALPTYLAAVHKVGQGGTRDVIIHGYDMTTPDGTTLLSDTSVLFPRGRRFGLVGRNGIGKTMFLKKLASYAVPGFPAHLKMLHVKQEVSGNETSVLQIVLDADLELKALTAQKERLERVEQEGPDSVADDAQGHAHAIDLTLAQVHSRLDELGADSAPARAVGILNGLKFTPAMMQAPSRELSGGWRMRVALAAALFVAPDILMLDEPTNHLDFPAVLWLESYLQSYPKTVLVVSHDRHFLNAVVTDIALFENKSIHYYPGSYDNFVTTREEKYKADKRAYENNVTEIKQIEEYIHLFMNRSQRDVQDKKSKQVEQRKKKLEKMERLPNPDDRLDVSRIGLSFPDPGKLRKSLLVQLDAASFSYSPDRPLLGEVTAQVEMGMQIGVLGSNGVGKTTLVRMITGQLQATKGKVWLNGGIRHVVFTQHHTDQLDLFKTPIEHLQAFFPNAELPEIRAHVGRFGVTDETQHLQIGFLSGGQKSRVAFAVATWQCPHLIILDEPTNHLDLETIESLISGLREFPGAVVLVSHDRHFLKSVATQYWALKQSGFRVSLDFDEAVEYSYGKMNL